MELKKAANRILDQLLNLVQALSDEEFKTELPVLNKSTIGQHVRHTLEFFLCLQKGVEEGVINYDKREHDKAIETDRFVTIAKIDEIAQFLSHTQPCMDLRLEVSYGNADEELTKISSNLDRELAYNIEHGVHHMAIIKIGALSIRPDLNLPRDFGVAVSTLRYQQKQQQGASA